MSPHLLSRLLLLQLLLLLAWLLTAARPDLHLLLYLQLHLLLLFQLFLLLLHLNLLVLSLSSSSSSTSFYSLSSSSSSSTSTLFSLSHHHPGLPLAPAVIDSPVQVSLRSSDSDWLRLLRLLLRLPERPPAVCFLKWIPALCLLFTRSSLHFRLLSLSLAVKLPGLVRDQGSGVRGQQRRPPRSSFTFQITESSRPSPLPV